MVLFYINQSIANTYLHANFKTQSQASQFGRKDITKKKCIPCQKILRYLSHFLSEYRAKNSTTIYDLCKAVSSTVAVSLCCTQETGLVCIAQAGSHVHNIVNSLLVFLLSSRLSTRVPQWGRIIFEVGFRILMIYPSFSRDLPGFRYSIEIGKTNMF